MKVVWSEASVRRLSALRAYVAARDPAAADRLIRKLIALAESLERLPHRGRRVPELPGTPIRELVHGNYRIVYRASSQAVEVLTVFEGHRPLPGEDLPGE